MDPERLFTVAFDASNRALEIADGGRDVDLSVGGFPIRLRFAGSPMVEVVLPALSHLRQDASVREPALLVHIWDCQSAGLPSPLPAEQWNACTSWGELQATRGSSIHASRLMDVGVYSLVDLKTNRAVFWAHRADQVPPYARAAALRSILHVWLRARGRIFLHGAAVARHGRSVLLVGRGGSGKSTTALLCAYQGWQYLGDDYCLASLDGGAHIHSLYNSAKLSPDQWNRFERWTAGPLTIRDPQSGKAIVFLESDPAVTILPDSSLRAILLPTITSQSASRLQPESPVNAWKAMAPSTVLQLPGADQTDLAQMGKLARSADCFRLHLGLDWESIPSVIANAVGLE
jgi:hypothetical protein